MTGSSVFNKNNQSGYFESIFISLLFFLMSYLVFGFYFELYESLKASLIAGTFGYPPTDQWLTNWNFLLVPVWSGLSILFPQLPIYGIWNLLLIYTCFLLSYRLIQKTVNKGFGYKILCYIIVLLILFQELININGIRLTITLHALIMLNYLYTEQKSKQKRILYYCFFTVITLIRIEASFVAPVIIACYLLLNYRNLFKTVKTVFPFAVISLIVIIVFNIAYEIRNDYGKVIEHEYSYFRKNKFEKDYSELFKTQYDSIRYVSYEYGLIADTAHITIPFLDSIVRNDIYVENVLSEENLNKSLWGINNLIKSYYIYLGICIMIALLYFSRFRIRDLTQTFLFFLLPFVLGLVFEMTVNISHREFSPIISIVTLIILVRFFYVYFYEFKRQESYKLFLLAIVTVSLVPNIVSAKKSYQKNIEDYKKVLSDLKPHYEDGNILVLFYPYKEIISVDPLEKRDEIRFSAIYLWYYSFHLFASKESLEKYNYTLTDYRSILNFLKSDRKLLVISTPERMKVLKDYLKIVYNETFDFSPLYNNGQSSDYEFVILKEN